MKRVKNGLQFLLVLGLILLLAACGEDSTSGEATGESSGGSEEFDISNYPSEQLDFLIAFGPGGGSDTFSRTIIDVLQKHELYPETIVPENMEGGSGAIGYTYFKNNAKGDPYYITTTSGNFITTPLVSETEYDHKTFTPVGLLASDDQVLLVNADSEYETLEDLIKASKEKKISLGGTGAYGPDRIVTSLLEESANTTFNYVPFEVAGELVTGVLSGSVDVMVSNPSEVLGQIESGDLRAIAYSAEKRNPKLPEVPTFIESGYDFSFSIPRAVYLPEDVPEEVRQWWVDTLKKVVETPEWKAYLDNNTMTDYTLFGDEFSTYMDETVATFERVLKESGAME
ncbi:Bug family tripartite tricarboxylate transporter substrate binding protein [Metabacillus endolithicus]|uniref:Bug family tripartite tricarboxylate transporter substrate binding protein n=1 Tax=Metabacillus endolithicus TaxID=1535204 RepID=A0ABW5BZL9_9BACI|nr:tripartite tricarboxylate transporter substrate binding protein [Metabacillus endolithicus]UPG62496.1 tripartite tricarboxylate transporter substrate binding protein [Metabacillus endolithicus]